MDNNVELRRARMMRLGLEALAVEPTFEPIGPKSVMHSDKATEREIEQSKAISLKRIADAMDRFDFWEGALMVRATGPQ